MTTLNTTITINGRTNFNNFVASNGLNIMTSKEGKLYNVKSYHEGNMNKSILLGKLVSKEIAEDIVNKTLAENVNKNSDNTATLAQVQLNQVIEHLSELDNDDTIDIYNEYADDISCERIYHNDEMTLNEVFSTPYDAIRQTNNKDYNDNDDYFTFNGYGYAISFDYRLQDNSPIDIEELAKWIIDNDLFNDYDIEVTTLDDMYNAILDNLEDASSLDNIVNVAEYLGLTVEDFDSNNESPADYENSIINDIMNHIHSDFELLSNAAEFMKLDV